MVVLVLQGLVIFWAETLAVITTTPAAIMVAVSVETSSCPLGSLMVVAVVAV